MMDDLTDLRFSPRRACFQQGVSSFDKSGPGGSCPGAAAPQKHSTLILLLVINIGWTAHLLPCCKAHSSAAGKTFRSRALHFDNRSDPQSRPN